MLLLILIVIAMLAVANYAAGRKLLYPPVVFCSVWAFVLFLIWAEAPSFYSVSPKTLVIFALGCASFSVGGLVGQALPLKISIPTYDVPLSNRIINWMFVTVLCGAPFVYLWISSVSADYPEVNFFLRAYWAVNDALEKGDAPRIVGNLITLAPIMAMLACRERLHHEKRAVVAFLLAIVVLSMTGGRSGIVIMTLGVIAIEWLRTNRPSFSMIGSVFAVLVIGVTSLAILVPKGDVKEDASLWDNMRPVMHGLVSYAAGGIPAFSQVVESPPIVQHNWEVYNPIFRVMSLIGLHVDTPPRSSMFITVGPYGMEQNVYTAYFAYMDLGWVGTMILLSVVGFVVTRVYIRAVSGGRIAAIVYGYMFAAMLLSPYSDYFFMTVNVLLRLLIFSWLVYSFPVVVKRVRRLVHGRVESLIAARS